MGYISPLAHKPYFLRDRSRETRSNAASKVRVANTVSCIYNKLRAPDIISYGHRIFF